MFEITFFTFQGRQTNAGSARVRRLLLRPGYVGRPPVQLQLQLRGCQYPTPAADPESISMHYGRSPAAAQTVVHHERRDKTREAEGDNLIDLH